MSAAGLLVQLLNGLADASSLFLLSAGLSLIFGVSRIVNFAHGSLYMLGAYVAYSILERIGGTPLGFWGSVLLAALAVGAIGAMIEIVVLRRIYRTPELFQLLATFAVSLIVKDAVLAIWGIEDLLGPRAPGLAGAISILGRRLPQYDAMLILIGVVVLAGLHLLLTRTRWGVLLRAATQDRDMVGALGVNQALLMTSVFCLGAFLAGLGGALQLPREPANAGIDITAIGDAFVVVVVGGLGSIPGAFLAAVLIAEIKALCIALGTIALPFGLTIAFPKFTLVAEFVVMAVVLVLRPWGLLGKPQAAAVSAGPPETPLAPAGRAQKWLASAVFVALLLLPLLAGGNSYAIVLAIDIFVGVLFATSLHFIMGPGGMHSFGHAAYFGLGAYASALLLKAAGLPMPVALLLSPLGGGLGALLFGWFCVRLSGVYLAMLTLAFGQIVWSIVLQWDDLTGGSNGIIGVWPSAWLASKTTYFYLALVVCAACVLAIRRILFSPFGFALRATRDSSLRSEAIGIDVRRIQWIAFIVAGAFCGLAGGLFAFSKGSISPETISVSRSIDGLVMVLLGGVQSLAGPVIGAASFLVLQDQVARDFEYWRAALGVLILILVLAFPGGLVGALRFRLRRA
ncbi:MAG: ABC transporter permease [Hyphomicrobiales bacterium]|nr:ABC transporter permease [Hyphomicrobiales bacterium]